MSGVGRGSYCLISQGLPQEEQSLLQAEGSAFFAQRSNFCTIRTCWIHSSQFLSSSEHSVPFDGSAWPSGVYFLRLTAPNRQAATKLILLK